MSNIDNDVVDLIKEIDILYNDLIALKSKSIDYSEVDTYYAKLENLEQKAVLLKEKGLLLKQDKQNKLDNLLAYISNQKESETSHLRAA